MQVSVAKVQSILTRTTGFLRNVTSHSLQPYRGCSYGRALCGVGCYVRHNRWLTRGAPWGSFLEVRSNAAETYRRQVERERRWARRNRGAFSVFLSSSTDPLVPQEQRLGITRSVLSAMLDEPPDELVLQTHTHLVSLYKDLYCELRRRTRLRIHLSVESDRDRLPGLPPPASSVPKRLEAAARLREAGLQVVITVSPLLPIRAPEAFFARIAAVADAVVLDHFVEGDGTPDGSRTRKTLLPAAMAAVEPGSVGLEYRDRMVAVAQRHLPGRVGVNVEGFAARYLPPPR